MDVQKKIIENLKIASEWEVQRFFRDKLEMDQKSLFPEVNKLTFYVRRFYGKTMTELLGLVYKSTGVLVRDCS